MSGRARGEPFMRIRSLLAVLTWVVCGMLHPLPLHAQSQGQADVSANDSQAAASVPPRVTRLAPVRLPAAAPLLPSALLEVLAVIQPDGSAQLDD